MVERELCDVTIIVRGSEQAYRFEIPQTYVSWSDDTPLDDRDYNEFFTVRVPRRMPPIYRFMFEPKPGSEGICMRRYTEEYNGL